LLLVSARPVAALRGCCCCYCCCCCSAGWRSSRNPGLRLGWGNASSFQEGQEVLVCRALQHFVLQGLSLTPRTPAGHTTQQHSHNIIIIHVLLTL
jgi:hypothetical protein